MRAFLMVAALVCALAAIGTGIYTIAVGEGVGLPLILLFAGLVLAKIAKQK